MELQLKSTSTVSEIYTTTEGEIYQCDKERCWYVNFGGKLARFDYRNFLKLRKALVRIDIEQRLLDTSKAADFEIIFICACDHCYVLSLLEIIALKELMDGTFVMLELNCIINERLARNF